MTDLDLHHDQPAWIFGYGSLIWRTGFPFAKARLARVRDFRRRFWQGSTDHRGTPGAPGRVVTLVEQAGAECWGRAYLLAAEVRERILLQLDEREVGGYQRHDLRLTLANGESVAALTWVAWPDNPNYLGPASPRAIARQVLDAAGPSGPNPEYVLRLEAALRNCGRPDNHVTEIAAWLHRLGGVDA